MAVKFIRSCGLLVINWMNFQNHIFLFFSSKCGPRLSPEAAEKLKNRYVLMRNSAGEYERETGKKVTIPITVR